MGSKQKCRLCLSEAELCNSHIISELFYKPLYDNKHRFFQRGIGEERKTATHQKGIREYLLCKDCETKILSINEQYASRIVYGKASMNGPETYTTSGKLIMIEGVDYSKFKLFQLSILWRASISTLQEFSSVSLGEKHEEVIRKMILTENPGPQDLYPCITCLIHTDNGEPLSELIVPPVTGRFDGIRLYHFIFGSIGWAFLVSSNSHRPKSVYKPNFYLQENGRLNIMMMNYRQIETVTKLFTELPKQYPGEF